MRVSWHFPATGRAALQHTHSRWPMKGNRSQRADYKGERLHSAGGRAGRERIVNNVAKKGAEIWQPQIILLPGILPERTCSF